MNARFYDPEIAQFTTADSIIPNPYQPQTLNRYAFVNNNPINNRDPSGHLPMRVEQKKAWATEMSGAHLISTCTAPLCELGNPEPQTYDAYMLQQRQRLAYTAASKSKAGSVSTTAVDGVAGNPAAWAQAPGEAAVSTPPTDVGLSSSPHQARLLDAELQFPGLGNDTGQSSTSANTTDAPDNSSMAVDQMTPAISETDANEEHETWVEIFEWGHGGPLIKSAAELTLLTASLPFATVGGLIADVFSSPARLIPTVYLGPSFTGRVIKAYGPVYQELGKPWVDFGNRTADLANRTRDFISTLRWPDGLLPFIPKTPLNTPQNNPGYPSP